MWPFLLSNFIQQIESHDAFKNKINPIRKVHFNKENINFFEQSKNTLLRPPSHYLKFGGKKKSRA